MPFSEGSCPVPDFGQTVVRKRLLEVLARAGGRPVVLVGSSGSGKSVLCSQWARAAGTRAVWIDCDDAFAQATKLVGMVLGALPHDRDSPAPDTAAHSLPEALASLTSALLELCAVESVLVVLDDLGSPVDAGEFDQLDRFAAAVRRGGARLLVSTTEIGAWSAKARCAWMVLGEEDLALTKDEAVLVGEPLGARLTLVQSDELRESTQGHVALFLAVTAQAHWYGLEPASARTPSLDAILDRLVGEISSEHLAALRVLAAFGEGSVRDLNSAGVTGAEPVLRTLTRVLPLLTLGQTNHDGLTFRLHGLVGEYLGLGVGLTGGQIASVLDLVSERSDLVRACHLLQREPWRHLGSGWLARYGEEALELGRVVDLDRVFAALPVEEVVGDHAILALWSRVRYETGQYADAIAKARAARMLAEHAQDPRATRASVAVSMFATLYSGDLEQAVRIADEVVESQDAFVDDALLAQALLCIGIARLSSDDPGSAEPALLSAVQLSATDPSSATTAAHAANSLAFLPIVRDGDFHASRQQLSQLSNNLPNTPFLRVMIKGNLALCLTELGRINRASSLVRSAIREARRFGLDMLTAAYLSTQAQVRVVDGDPLGALADLRAAIEISTLCGDEAEAAISRCHLAMLLRAQGRCAESFDEAERALETLLARDAMQFRAIAELEVAASLLALGDIAVARTRVRQVMERKIGANQHLGLRGALILAECALHDDSQEGALGELEAYAAYIRSENANWLVALYSRAFPRVVGLVARLLGVADIPAHLLRMIPPEASEAILQAAQPLLGKGEWNRLGARLLGADEFALYLARGGLPVLHVHFFGGLEVSVGGRSIRERDWRKRKARLLFTMLLLRRGQDVPREQLLEHLFPEMEPERAKNNLYVIWSTMKSAIMTGAAEPGFPYFEAVGGVCRCVRQNIRLDVDDFDKLVVRGREHYAKGQIAESIHCYESIAGLYRGDLLPGDIYDDWFAETRDEYRIQYVEAMMSAGAILTELDDPVAALSYVRRALQADPLREDLYQAALRCQIAAGQRSAAIDTYFTCRNRLSEDLGLDPSPETRALYQQILAMEDRPIPLKGEMLYD